MCASRNHDFRVRRARPRRRRTFGLGLEPLEQRLCLSVIPVSSPITLDPQSIAQQLGVANVSIASDANGDFVATWDVSPNTADTHVDAQRFNAQGQPVGNEIQVDNFTGGAGPQEESSVAMDSGGNFTVVWDGFDSAGDASGIFMRQFNANGTPVSASPVPISAVSSGVFPGDPQIAMDPTTDAFVITWTQPGIDVDESEGVLGEWFNTKGQGTVFEANTFTTGNQFEPGVAMGPTGNFVITWLSDGQNINGEIGVYAQRFGNTGKPVGSEFQAYTQLEVGQVDHPSVAFAPDGGFIIASDSQTTDGTGAVFTVGRFNSSGKAAGPAQIITDTGLDAGTAVAFDPSGDGEALLARSSDGVVTGQLISATGQLDGSPFTIYQAPSGFTAAAFNPAITTLPGDKFLVAFQGFVASNVNLGVGAQELASDAGQTPPPTDTLDYAKRAGTTIDDSGTKVVTDAFGNVYMVGQIGVDGATEIGTVVQKYQADGTLLWSKTFGPAGGGDTTDFAQPAGVAVDSNGNVYIAGTFDDTTDFDPGSGAANRTPSASGDGSSDSFILTLDSNGNFVHVTTLGGPTTADVEITAIGIDAADDIYVTGAFNGDVAFGSTTLSTGAVASNVLDGFLWKFDSTGATQWALQLGNEATLTAITALAVDPSGNAYLVALAGFGDAVNFDPLGFGTDLGAAAFGTVVVAKYDPTGHLAWANGYDEAASAETLPTAIDVDPQGDVYAAGIFSSSLSFNPIAIPTVPSGTNANAFLLKLTGDGAFTWVRTVGGTAGSLFPNGIVTDQNGNIFESGVLTGLINANPGAGLALLSSDGGSASVVSGFDSNGNLISADLFGGGANSVFVTSIAADQFGRLYLTGGFTGAADFDPTAGTTNLTSAGGKDIFFAKLSTAFALPEPEIGLTGNGVAIPAGESGPATANATNFGTAVSMAGTTTETFTIKNTGNGDLHLTGDLPVQITGADAGDFSVLTQPAATVPAGGTTTFTVQFAPVDVNTRTAAITIASDDPDHPQFTFAVQGFGQLSGSQPALAVTIAPAALPATLLPGQKIKVSFVVTNVGAGLAKGTVQFAFYFGIGDTFDTMVDLSVPGFSKAVNLALGKSVTLTESFTVPATIDPGMVRLFVIPDATNVLNEGNQGDNTAASAQSNLVWQFGNVAGKKSVKLVLPNPAGVLTTFSLSGNGTGQVIPGDVPGVWDLMLTSTDTHSAVTITTPGGKTTTIRNITDDSDLKSFTAKTTDITGNVTFSGVISTLTLADATAGGQEIQIGNDPALPVTPVTLTLGRASELSVNSLSPIKSLTAVEWLDPSATRDTIAAPSLGTLKITGNKQLASAGDFDADVLLSDATVKSTLTTATIAGTLMDSVVRAAGNIGSITVGRLDDASILAGFTTTPAGLPSQPSDFAGAFTLTTLTVRGETGQPVSVIDSLIAAATISTITLKDVELDNSESPGTPGTPFGVAAETIKSYTRLVTGGQSVKLKSLHTQTANAEPGDTGDFVVRIVSE